MQYCKELNILCMSTTVSSLETGKTLAREILARKLAACVQLDQGVISLYRWKGELCEEAEVRLVIKSLPGCEAALQELLARHHPYELAQFLVEPMSASQAYAKWVHAEVAMPPVQAARFGSSTWCPRRSCRPGRRRNRRAGLRASTSTIPTSRVPRV